MRRSVETLEPDDWPEVEAIHREGIATGDATFETDPPSWDDFDAGHLPRPRLVARGEDRALLGWAALSPVSRRPVYRGVAEVSLYVAAASRRQGVGAELLDRLVHASEGAGLWTLRAGIFPENAASIALHQAAGFRRVGVFERVGRMNGRGPGNGRWRDVVVLERRSKIVGVD